MRECWSEESVTILSFGLKNGPLNKILSKIQYYVKLRLATQDKQKSSGLNNSPECMRQNWSYSQSLGNCCLFSVC